MNEPRGRPVAKPVTGGLNARAKPSPLLVLSSSSTGGQPPPLPPPSSLRGRPIRWKARPRKLPRGLAAEDPKLLRKKNAATTRSSLFPCPDEGRTSAQSASSSCSSSSSSSSSGLRRRPRRLTDAVEEEEEEEGEGSVASRSVETTEDDLTQDSSFDKEDDDLTRGSSYSADDDYDDDRTNNDLAEYSRGSRDARSHGPRRGRRGNLPAPILKSRDRKAPGRGRRRSESDGGGGERRRAAVRGRGEDYYYYDDGISLLDAVSPCCSSLCVIREGVNDLTRRWRRRAGSAPSAVDVDDDIDDVSDEMRDAEVDSWEDYVSRVSERPASPPPDPPVTLRIKRQVHKTKLV